MHTEPTFTVAELASVVSRTLDRSFPTEVWVRGEIRNLQRPASGHVYFDLVDGGDPSTSLPASPVLLPVTLFVPDRDAVNRALVRAGAGRFEDGIEIRIRGRLNFYPARSTVRLRMTWIDTQYTVGRLAAARERVLEALAADGLLDRNRALPTPLVPLRVGLVTSEGSAAHADFVHELRGAGYGFQLILADARVQGPAAAESLVAAFTALQRAQPHLIAVVRGGGSRTDLAAFDQLPVARAAALSPVPVYVGIGHEIDETVVDRVAAASFKTPTACAAAVVNLVSRFLDRLDTAVLRLAAAGRDGVDRNDRTLMTAATRLERIAVVGLRLAGSALDGRARFLGRAPEDALRRSETVVSTDARRVASSGTARVASHDSGLAARTLRLGGAHRALERETQRLEKAAASVRALDPQRILARGWSLTTTETGTVVRSVVDVAPGQTIQTTVADGRITSRVTSPPNEQDLEATTRGSNDE